MCGLVACLLYPIERTPETWIAIKHGFTQGLLANEKRGRDASGIAVRQRNGRLQLHKAPLPAHQLVTTPGYTRLWQQVDAQTTLILGHARYPTKGKTAVNANNHPLVVDQVCGIHNGHVHNDDALFAHHAYPRQGQVDSEIIFRLLNQVVPQPTHPAAYVTEAVTQIRSLRGIFTFLANDQRAPHQLVALKHTNPISLYYHPDWQVLLFSSSYLYLRQTFGHIVCHQMIPRDILMIFDAEKLPQYGHEPVATVALP